MDRVLSPSLSLPLLTLFIPFFTLFFSLVFFLLHALHLLLYLVHTHFQSCFCEYNIRIKVEHIACGFKISYS